MGLLFPGLIPTNSNSGRQQLCSPTASLLLLLLLLVASLAFAGWNRAGTAGRQPGWKPKPTAVSDRLGLLVTAAAAAAGDRWRRCWLGPIGWDQMIETGERGGEARKTFSPRMIRQRRGAGKSKARLKKVISVCFPFSQLHSPFPALLCSLFFLLASGYQSFIRIPE